MVVIINKNNKIIIPHGRILWKDREVKTFVKLQVVHKGPNCRKDHRHCQTWHYQRGLIMGIRIRQELHVVVAPFQILSKRLGPSCHPASKHKAGNLSTVARNIDLSTYANIFFIDKCEIQLVILLNVGCFWRPFVQTPQTRGTVWFPNFFKAIEALLSNFLA